MERKYTTDHAGCTLPPVFMGFFLRLSDLPHKREFHLEKAILNWVRLASVKAMDPAGSLQSSPWHEVMVTTTPWPLISQRMPPAQPHCVLSGRRDSATESKKQG